MNALKYMAVTAAVAQAEYKTYSEFREAHLNQLMDVESWVSVGLNYSGGQDVMVDINGVETMISC